MTTRLPALLALTAALGGCGVISGQSVYEGTRATQKARTMGTEPQPRELPPYDEYERERAKASR